MRCITLAAKCQELKLLKKGLNVNPTEVKTLMVQLEYLLHNGGWDERAGESLSYPGFLKDNYFLNDN